MTIKLRIVGIFYSVALEPLQVKGGSVEAVLNAAVSNPGPGKKFHYTLNDSSISEYKSVSSFTAKYDNPFTSSVSEMDYPAGEYFLPENLIGNPYTVWQYYVLDENGKRVPLPSPTAPYTTDLGIKDGYSVIWRLVSILSGPTSLPPSKRRLMTGI